MRKIIYITLLLSFLPLLVKAQTPKRIHDLKSLTDSSGTVHLFYRIFSEYEGTEYITDNIYHYNTQTGEEVLFFENFYDDRLGFPFSQNITDYKFLDNDPENYVFTIRYCDNECSELVGRNDSTEGMGGLFVTMDNLNVVGTDSGRVYVEAFGETIIGRNGGRDWPDVDAETFEEIPDSSKLVFPLTSLSPYNDSLMFGIRYSFGADDNGFFRSQDKGNTSEFVSDTLYGNSIQYDINEETIYLLDTIGAPGSDQNCSIDPCKYGLYRSDAKGESDSWQMRNVFSQNATLVAHPIESGKLYAWTTDSLLVSEDYGGHFEILVKPTKEITGFTATPYGEYYTTNSTLYKIQGDNLVELFSIPVSNEVFQDIPNENKLLQNYPNPFNPTTTISYEMKSPGQAVIKLYTVTGQLVTELLNTYKTPGSYSFQLNGADLSSGTYILRGRLGDMMDSKIITLIK